jgi:hypothetical protein
MTTEANGRGAASVRPLLGWHLSLVYTLCRYFGHYSNAVKSGDPRVRPYM